MVSLNTQESYLVQLLTSRQVKNIESSIFVATNPSETLLPPTIDSGAIQLLKTICGHIYPIALRGKCQAGKSTTLNRIAKLANFPIERLLEVAEGFGGSTTEGIWLMIITFTNNDVLLLFDVQGTDRGADELTHKLIAFTDHVCTKVVDVFRMPIEGFSNEYINSLYCLAMGRDSVENLRPASDKAILWTNCVLPKRSPLKSRSMCSTPEEYQMELLTSSVGERAIQGAKAKTYAERTPIITTGKPSDEILFQISELENDHQFIQETLMPALKQILKNVQPLMHASHAITDGESFVQYLSNVYNNIKSSTIDLPFCALPMIRSIAISIMKEKKQSFQQQINQKVADASHDISQISNTLLPKIQEIRKNCIVEFKRELSDLPTEQWQDQLTDFEEFMANEIRQIVERFKPNVLEHFLGQRYPKLNHLCQLGSEVNKLKIDCQVQINKTMEKMAEIPFLQGNINTIDREYVQRALSNHRHELCQIQDMLEKDWKHRMSVFEKEIYSTAVEGVGKVIQTIIAEYLHYAQQQYSRFHIHWRPFFNIDMVKRQLTEDNVRRSHQAAAKCKAKCISEFNEKIGAILASNMSVPDKYGKIKNELEMCLRRYYEKLPWPLNDETIGSVDQELQQIFKQVMRNLYTPAVKEQLKRDRVAQMQMMNRLNLDGNESMLWVYCVNCQRIFAGRTRGCVKVTCSHFHTKQGSTNADHGCGTTFEWAKAQPVPIESLPPEIWFSNIETDQRSIAVGHLMSEALHGVRRACSAGTRVLRRSHSNS